MLVMRPATPEDQSALAAMIQARSDWMREKQLPNWRCWGRHVKELASTCSGRYGEMWVLIEDNERVLGCTTIIKTAAPWAWTENEAADSALYLSATVTDPTQRHRKLGTLIASWAVDHAAQSNINCVRRDCTSLALATYYQQQKFTLVRQVSHPGGVISYALEREAAEIPELAGWFRVKTPRDMLYIPEAERTGTSRFKEDDSQKQFRSSIPGQIATTAVLV